LRVWGVQFPRQQKQKQESEYTIRKPGHFIWPDRVRQEKKAIYDGNFFVSRKHWEETNGTLKFVVDFQQVQVLPIQSP